jgi:hypothetical protein
VEFYCLVYSLLGLSRIPVVDNNVLSFAVEDSFLFTADEDIIQYFTEGQCNALAFQLHKLTGWTLALLSDEPVGSEDYMGHVFVIDSYGYAIDIEGRRPLQELLDRWDYCPLLYRFFNLQEFELEMALWDNKIHYTRDREAKWWAKYIVDMLCS